MRVPSKLVEKTLSALQIAKITGAIKTGLLENIRALESNKAEYLIIASDAKPRDKKIKKKFLLLQVLAKDQKIFSFEISTREELGKIVGLEMGTSSIIISKGGRASPMFKSLAEEMAA